MIPELPNPLTSAKVIGNNIAAETYIRQDAKRGDRDYIMSRGDLVEFAKCPHRWVMGYKEDGTGSTEWGSLVDCMVLTPEMFQGQYAVAPATYTAFTNECPQCGSRTDSKKCSKCKVDRVPIEIEKEWNWNATVCQEWLESRPGIAPIKAETHVKAQTAVDRLYADRQIAELLHGAQRQVMVMAEYRDRETGIVVPVKGLIDFVPSAESEWPKALGDFKTAADASPWDWIWTLFKRGYHVQAALYLDAYCAATGEDRVCFLHIVQENYEPYEVGKRLLSDEFIQMGRLEYVGALKRYCGCLASGQWPGYDEHDRTIINGFTLSEPQSGMIGRI